jgi:hypothetical protein
MRCSRRQVLVAAVVAPLGLFVPSTVGASVPTTAKMPRGGLGLTGKEWREIWGDPDAEPKGKYWKFEYKRFGVVARLLYLEDNQHEVGFDVSPAAPIARDHLMPNVERFLPKDTQFVEEYPRPSGPGTVVISNSQWLAERFLALEDPVISDWFPGGNPGDIIAIYQKNESGDVENVVIGMGNNP